MSSSGSDIVYSGMSSVSSSSSDFSGFYIDADDNFADGDAVAISIPHASRAPTREEPELQIEHDCEQKLWEFHYRMQSLRSTTASPSPAEEQALESFMHAYSERLMDAGMDEAAAAASQPEREEVFTLEW